MPAKLNLKAPAKGVAEVEPLLTVEEAARLLAVSRSYLDKDRFDALHQGRPPIIPYVKVGKSVRYRADVIRRVMAEGT